MIKLRFRARTFISDSPRRGTFPAAAKTSPFSASLRPLARNCASLQTAKTLLPATEDPPRRLNRFAELRRFKLPHIPTAHHAEIPPVAAPVMISAARHPPDKVLRCSAASEARRGRLSAQERFRCAHCRAG